MSRHRIFVLLLLGLTLLLPQPAAAGGRPLLVEGKKTLFQRVLVRPHARLKAEPGGEPAGPELRPFDVFYVYDRKEAAGGSWLQLGRAADGRVQGWLEADKAIDWRQTIVVAFANPGVTGRALLFDTKDHLMELLEAEDRVPRVRELRGQATAGQLPQGSPVLSIQPDTYVDITRQFYLLPILESERVRLRATRRQAQLLKVASVP